ncbi:hypothetical protein INR49_001483 [Caranx melampygus]|nr:hypothetical protein INR49_001483 [Caranx melampygus]
MCHTWTDPVGLSRFSFSQTSFGDDTKSHLVVGYVRISTGANSPCDDSLPTRSSTVSTFIPACLCGGSSTLNTSNRDDDELCILLLSQSSHDLGDLEGSQGVIVFPSHFYMNATICPHGKGGTDGLLSEEVAHGLTASSTAISQKGFIECLTPSVTTPLLSGFTRICGGERQQDSHCRGASYQTIPILTSIA